MQQRVIYGDTDQMGVVYYANYLRYFEASRNEYLREKGMRYRELEARGILLPVIEANVRYRAPAHYDDLLRIEARVTEQRRVTARFEYRIFRDETLLVEGSTLHACIDRNLKPMSMPDDLRAILG